jgi:predicted nuclease of predicted toxin-antitoxin system
LRLLLDEMYPQSIAEQLRRDGHDAIAVTERPELRSFIDPDLFATAQQERRAVITENIADFVPLADHADQRNQPHHGLVLVDPAKYQRGSPRTIGRIVSALEALLAEHPAEEATSARHWL